MIELQCKLFHLIPNHHKILFTNWDSLLHHVQALLHLETELASQILD